MILDFLDQLFFQRLHIGGGAEAAVVHMSPGPPGNLGEFRWIQAARQGAVIFHRTRKGDMVDIHIQAHADGVCRHQIVHIPGLIERNLRIAGAGRQIAHDDGCPAALSANKFGDGVDVT